jgi:hypothetical protein
MPPKTELELAQEEYRKAQAAVDAREKASVMAPPKTPVEPKKKKKSFLERLFSKGTVGKAASNRDKNLDELERSN